MLVTLIRRPTFSAWLVRRQSVCLPLAVAALLLTAARAAEPVDDDVVEDAPAPVDVIAVPVTDVYDWVFGTGYDRNLARDRLDSFLREKIATLDVTCDLTEEQRRKLQLSGRGDIKRLIDRLETIAASLRREGGERLPMEAPIPELNEIKRNLTAAFSKENSLLGKVTKRILTPAQNARIAFLRETEQAGAQVFLDSNGPSAVLEISLSGMPFTDDNLARLTVLTRLQGLNLTSTRVTDAGLIHLRGLTNLQALDLTGVNVTDAGIAALNQLQALQRLELFGTQVTAAGLAHLRNLTGLKELNLSDTRVTDAGLKHLQGMKKLHSLNLHGTQILDAGLAELTELTSLESLDVSRTQVSDTGIAHLKKLRNLQRLNLSSTQVTDAGLADLKRALPAANVWKRPVPEPE